MMTPILILVGVGCDEPEDFGPITLGNDGSTPGMQPPPAPTGPTDPGLAPRPPADCADGETYPVDVAEPMALGEVLAPYSWPEAIQQATGDKFDLDLSQVPCALDPDIDWSPFDVLLFVSIPAW